MHNQLIRRTGDGTEWREPALLNRGPAAGAEQTPTPPRGSRTTSQRCGFLDGTTRRLDLPAQTEPGEWREVIEDGRRLLAYRRADGSRSVVVID